MQNKYMKLAAKVTAAATLLSMFAVVAPAFADDATSMSDTLSREAVSVTGITHTVKITLPTSYTEGATGNLTLTYTGDWANFQPITSAACAPSGGAGTDNGTATNVVNITNAGCAAGDVETIVFTGDNSSTTGSHQVTIGGDTATTGSFAVPLVTNDQISVTATVDPSISFDVGADTQTCDGTWTSGAGAWGDGYTVAFGVVPTTAVNVSDTGTVNHICTKVSTNATHGVQVTVKNLNSGNGLVSASVSGDHIPSATAAMVAGTSNYGICASSTGGETGSTISTPASNDPVGDSFATGSCTGSQTDSVFGFDGTSQDTWHTVGVTNQAFWKFYASAAVSGTQPAHADYADTLTFIATGTF